MEYRLLINNVYCFFAEVFANLNTKILKYLHHTTYFGVDHNYVYKN